MVFELECVTKRLSMSICIHIYNVFVLLPFFCRFIIFAVALCACVSVYLNDFLGVNFYSFCQYTKIK